MAGQALKERTERRKLEAELDMALAQTFPASDPYSVGHFTSTEPPARPVDRLPPVISPEQSKASRAPRRRKPSS